MSRLINLHFHLTPQNNSQIMSVCGQSDINLHQIEAYFGIEINNRGHHFELIGSQHHVQQAKKSIETLFHEAKNDTYLSAAKIRLVLQSCAALGHQKPFEQQINNYSIKTPKLLIKPRTPNQLAYIKSMSEFDINFGISSAGTGKTYLATAFAVQTLTQEKIRRIIIVKPAVEAGEHLGFLLGDIAEKVNPYLRPIYDALYDMHHFSTVDKLIEKNIIEIAPLAFMRGRTLNDAMIILDEAQNTTVEQMKMLLTRIGFNSKAMINGDITQIDLTKNKLSGLKHAIDVLKNESDIGFTFFQTRDVIRHTLVQKIINAYECYDKKSLKG
jgi:phosphate starvation-inducible PhoH-like protein